MSRSGGAVALAVIATGLGACRATTGRPSFVPYPEAAHGEIGFGTADRVATIVRSTRALAAALTADSLPVSMVREEDGYLETPWFDAASLKPTAKRPLGPGVVRVRGWVTPSKPGFSEVEVETVYQPLADPSRPARELETPVAEDHPVGRRVAEVVKQLVEKYGEPDESTAGAKGRAPAARPPPGAAVRPPTRPDTTERR